ncbi:TIGR02206 family membrane protein [Sporosarcina limicola]|uniref:Integral membrane protein (TIGR02206 family) n=1 Tax=Sporosarcina limicola TaxID=34101 RepID=A0A927MLF2_9BACL|nr:TIGR02206 family membrane protein [Sporosarcina limicola]MBE1556108.1 putative integral membrane protein (TIGR02206 family) [Sporosarcina limicola]
MSENNESAFVMFSLPHFAAIGLLIFAIILLYSFKRKVHVTILGGQRIERVFAISLLMMELYFHMSYMWVGRWAISYSLPLELCSFSLIVAITLLWTGNRHLVDFVFYAGIGGAIQAFLTPVIDFGYPHFRYFHFFYVHGGIILTALYFYRMKGYRPTFKGIIKTMVTLNGLLPVIFAINWIVNGNYMFLQQKPSGGSLLDYLGPYPWYILSLEAVAFTMFLGLWLVFKGKRRE